jgi:hypothetical protein
MDHRYSTLDHEQAANLHGHVHSNDNEHQVHCDDRNASDSANDNRVAAPVVLGW